jgi:hypothetical protein
MQYFPAVLAAFLFMAVLASAQPSAAKDDFIQPYTAAQTLELFADTCVKQRRKGYLEFRDWADSIYYRIKGGYIAKMGRLHGFGQWELWSPTEDLNMVFLARGINDWECLVGGYIDRPDKLNAEIQKLIESRPGLFRDVWQTDDLIVERKELDAPEHMKKYMYYISTPSSLSDYELLLKIYSHSTDRNFSLSYGRGLDKERMDIKRDRQKSAR